jgi:hypothetical protein
MKKAKRVLSALEVQWAEEERIVKVRCAARAKYREMQERAEKVEAQFPALYIYDLAISLENAADGLVQNEGIRIHGVHECDWPAIAFEEVARHIENDCGVRLAELGMVPADYGFRY